LHAGACSLPHTTVDVWGNVALAFIALTGGLGNRGFALESPSPEILGAVDARLGTPPPPLDHACTPLEAQDVDMHKLDVDMHKLDVAMHAIGRVWRGEASRRAVQKPHTMRTLCASSRAWGLGSGLCR
jgi:hypothetical protein